METILNTIVDNYVIILMETIVLIFALIGYFVDAKRRKGMQYKINKQEEINLESLEVKENIALSDAVNKNKSVGVVSEPINMSTTDTVESLDNNQNITQ